MLHLRLISGTSKGRFVPLAPAQLPLTIGRDPENKLVLDHTAISRYHCRITFDDGEFYIEDLGSTNGTYLNGRRVERARLSPGDELIVAAIGMLVEAANSSILEQKPPLNITVSIDAKPRKSTVTASGPAESSGTGEFLAGLGSDPASAQRALQVLYNADSAFRNIEDLQALLDNLLGIIMESVPASRGFVFLIDKNTGGLAPYARRPGGPDTDDAEIVVSQTILQTAVRQKTSIISSDALVDERFIHSRSIAGMSVRSAMCAPLVSRGVVLGIVYVDSHKASAFSRRDLALFSAVALKVAIAVDNARLYDDLRGLFYNTVETLVRTIQAKDQYTAGHSTRVSRYALMVADRLGLSTKEKHHLYLAAMLHDIGKIGVPDDLLNRPGKLSESEMDRVRSHVQVGASMIEMLGEMHPIVPLIRHHHECYDGSGYPDGLKGEQIPLISRIIAVADMYDAMTSDRPYRKRRTHQTVVDEIITTSGTKLDPRVANAFLEVLKDLVPGSETPVRAPEVPTESPVR
ncbi:MAG: FHA domain-containing protein [Candidatus Krumholzibacteria bacterium]|nr:FHA domain-containing protein [Candidatus Krumholzibacteria bacterium]MDH4338444.1 FHA domain-containing protein [Candidatus Krumholzibacteria bacterium]MDH5271071.1 FHA domain-containing protein [Candidatus Krumholzibacteria bacterium]